MTTTRMPKRSAFLEALGHLAATSPPGAPISVEAVGAAADMERSDAIRTGLELIDEGWVSGVPLRGDGEIKTINGLELHGLGRRELGRQRGLRFMLELEAASEGDPDAAVSAAPLGLRSGWSAKETENVVDTLVGSGLIEHVEMGSDLVRMTDRGRQLLNRALDDDVSPGQPIASVVVIGDVTNSAMQVGTVASSQQQINRAGSQHAEIADFVEELRRQLPALGLSDDDSAAVEADLAAVEAQLNSPRPNEGVLREALRTLRAVAESVTGNAAFAGLIELARQIQF